MKRKRKNNAFTLLELVVVLAGLGILSSLAYTQVVDAIKYAKVDEAKALLNMAAANCLQELRMAATDADKTAVLDKALSDPNNPLDDILSSEKLTTIGYKFSGGLKTCGGASISPASPDDNDIYPTLSFTIMEDGSLFKNAESNGEKATAAAKSWAGSRATESGQLQDWQNYNETIRKAKIKCTNDMNNGLSNTNNKGAYDAAWDETATSGCPKGPPKVENATCTPEGCNERIYGYKGVTVSIGRTKEAQQAYFDYVEIQKGKDCAQALKTLSDANPPTHTGVDGMPIIKCDSDIYWFHRGEEVSADTWKSRMCAENKKNLLDTIHSGPIEYCQTSPIYIIDGEEILPNASREDAKAEFDDRLENNKELKCRNLIREDAKKKTTPGPHTSPTPEGMEPIIPDD